jgi:hypothetical protein
MFLATATKGLGEKEPRTGKQLMAFSMFWRRDVSGKICLDAMDLMLQPGEG